MGYKKKHHHWENRYWYCVIQTERPEGVKAGTLKLVGTDPAVVKSTMTELLTNEHLYLEMANARNPYGDGRASERIVQAIKHYFGQGDAAEEFHEGEKE